MEKKNESYILKGSHVLKFAILSILGVFLFIVLLPDSEGSLNIPLGYAINWLGTTLNAIDIGGFGSVFIIAAVAITLSLIGTVITYLFKPAFIVNNDMLKSLFLSSPVYFVSKAVAVTLVWMVFFGVGPDWLIGWTGARLMMDLIAGGSSGSNLMTIFLVLGLAIPLLTDFGLMEFLGVLIRKIVRFLFTLPGRSSIDLMGSWFSSSAAGVIITRNQHEKGFYTGREAAAICVNFTFVSLPFTFLIASVIDLTEYFLSFYLIICATVIILAVIMPRIWPLRGLKDEYLPEAGKQIDEDVPAGESRFAYAVKLAGQKASGVTPVHVVKSGLSNWLNIFMDLIPVILAWGTIALIIEAQTPIFDWLSLPFAGLLNLMGVEGAFDYGAATIVGFVDMYIPAILLGKDAPFEIRFILGALSIVQIIYLAETGILILKSKIPLNIGHLAVIFLMRTLFAIPILVGLTRLFM